MPMERAAESLRTFSLDILARVHTISNKPTAATKKELQDVSSKYLQIRAIRVLHLIRVNL